MTLWSFEGWCQRPLWLLSCHSGGTESPSEIDPSGTKIAVLCLCTTFVSFVYACCVCLWKFSRLRPLPTLGSAVWPLQETETEFGEGSARSDRVDTSVVPLLCPCGGINSRMEEAMSQ